MHPKPIFSKPYLATMFFPDYENELALLAPILNFNHGGQDANTPGYNGGQVVGQKPQMDFPSSHVQNPLDMQVAGGAPALYAGHWSEGHFAGEQIQPYMDQQSFLPPAGTGFVAPYEAQPPRFQQPPPHPAASGYGTFHDAQRFMPQQSLPPPAVNGFGLPHQEQHHPPPLFAAAPHLWTGPFAPGQVQQPMASGPAGLVATTPRTAGSLPQLGGLQSRAAQQHFIDQFLGSGSFGTVFEFWDFSSALRSDEIDRAAAVLLGAEWTWPSQEAKSNDVGMAMLRCLVRLMQRCG